MTEAETYLAGTANEVTFHVGEYVTVFGEPGVVEFLDPSHLYIARAEVGRMAEQRPRSPRYREAQSQDGTPEGSWHWRVSADNLPDHVAKAS